MKKHLLIAVCCTAFLNYSFAQSWSLTGNAGTAPANNFVGTTDNKPLVFRTNDKERMRILSNGKIGVGTKTPAAYFHSFGTMQIENNSGTVYDEPLLTLRNSAANGTTTNPVIAFKGEDTLFAVMGYDFSTRDMVFSTQAAGITPDLIINHDNGFTGLNTKTPQERLHVLGNQILDGDLTMASTLGKGDINFTTDQQNIAFAAPGSSSSAMIYMTNNASTTNRRMVLARDNGNGSTGLQYEFSSDVFNFMKNASSKLRIDLTNGRIGINDNTPSYPLDVNGNTQILGNLGVQTAPGTRTIQAGNTQGALIGIGTIEYIQDAGTNALSFNENLIPVSDDQWTLGNSTNRWSSVWAVDGTINTSDARDKSNIRDLNYGLKEIMQLRPVKFNWKNNPADGDKLGVVAQEIQKVLPEVVRDWEYQIDEQTGKKTKVSTEKLGVMYADIIPVLIRSIQELKQEIEQLKQAQTATGNNSSAVVLNNTALSQNVPNPVKNTTVIHYNIGSNAQLVVKDQNGNTVKQMQINGKGSVTVDCTALSAGTYTYTLIGDGKMIDSKKMVVTK